MFYSQVKEVHPWFPVMASPSLQPTSHVSDAPTKPAKHKTIITVNIFLIALSFLSWVLSKICDIYLMIYQTV